MKPNFNLTLRNILWRVYVTLFKSQSPTCNMVRTKCLKVILWLHKLEDNKFADWIKIEL